MARLKGAVIGCGAIAREHIAAVAELQNAEIAAVCDLSAARAEATAERFSVAKWYTDFETMLSEVTPDLVHIATPPASHFPIARACLDRKFNVLCEKPITLDYAQFAELLGLARERQVVLIENHNFRYHSAVRRICDLIDSGEFGDVIDVQISVAVNVAGPGSPYVDRNAPHFGESLRGGVVGDFLTHISYLTTMFAGRAESVRMIWKKTDASLPLPADEFRAIVKAQRATAYVSFSGHAHPNGFWLRVSGTRMHAEANLFETPRLALRRARNGTPPLMTLVDGIAEARDIFRTSFSGLGRKLSGRTAYDGLPVMIGKIYDALETGAPQPVPLEEIDSISQLVDFFTHPDIAI